MKTPLLYLSAADVRRALPMPDAIEATRDAYRQLINKEVTLPVRERMDAPDDHGIALVMPCYSSAEKLFSVKFVTVFHENRQRGLPLVQSTVILADGVTGEHVAILDGGALTAIRTGAASGAATDALARPDAETVAIFGAGVQAATQLEAVCCVRKITRARVFDPFPESAERFASEMTERLGVCVERAGKPSEALAGADVVCAATPSTTPVFDDGDLSPGTHINGVGSYRPDMTEIPSATVCRARVVVDHLESVLEEAGDLIVPLREGLIEEAHIRTELGAVLLDRAQGRTSPEEITFFKSVGVAIQDLSAAAMALANARRLGVGVEL